MKKVTICTVLALGLSGCAQFDYLDNVVNNYCAADEISRSAVRAQVNADIAPHSVKITCSGDALSN